jgi:hypothetical protein
VTAVALSASQRAQPVSRMDLSDPRDTFGPPHPPPRQEASLPFRVRADRVDGYGSYEYFIHVRDARHPERQFIEWVTNTTGRAANGRSHRP